MYLPLDEDCFEPNPRTSILLRRIGGRPERRKPTMGRLIYIMRMDAIDAGLNIYRMRKAGESEAQIHKTADKAKVLVKTWKALDAHVANISELSQRHTCFDACLSSYSACNRPGAKKARKLLFENGSAACETVVEEENERQDEDNDKPILCVAKLSVVGLSSFYPEASASTSTSIVSLLTSEEVNAPQATSGDRKKQVQKCRSLPSEPAALSTCPASSTKLLTPSQMSPVTNQSGSG